ncbi:copper homeostasis protein [Rutstroemia sp. NJR-2017a BBW]|nr:copper homeostasis protein [Rutstroemia sp. NJR-2017a BBW]
MAPPPHVEIAAFTPSSALLAAHAGAHRIELCQDKAADGLTPELDDFTKLKDQLNEVSPSTAATPLVQINIMIRPSSNASVDFTVPEREYSIMREQITQFKLVGGEGFVFGILKRDALTEKLRVDEERCGELVELCRSAGDDGSDEKAQGLGRRCTFHRAFDRIAVEDMEGELDVLIKLGFTAVLTSGGGSTAMEGADVVRRLVERAKGRIDIIVGGGVRSAMVGELRKRTGAEWFHSSAVVGEGEEVCDDEVRDLRRVLDGTDGS